MEDEIEDSDEEGLDRHRVQGASQLPSQHPDSGERDEPMSLKSASSWSTLSPGPRLLNPALDILNTAH